MKPLRVFLLLSIIALSLGESSQMIVRVYVKDYEELTRRIDFKQSDIEIASFNKGISYDLIIKPSDYPLILASGLKAEIIIKDLAKEKERILKGGDTSWRKGRYHSYDEVNQILRNLATTFPHICQLESLGRTYEGRQIYGVKISDAVNTEDPNEPDILYWGAHHAREWATIEVCLFIADTLIRGYGNDTAIRNIVNSREIYIFPIMNPDGYVYDYPAGNSWRKNREPFGGAIGTDLNRNHPGACSGEPIGDWGSVPRNAQVSNYPSSEVFCGRYGASAKEIKGITDFFRKKEIVACLSYHSYGEYILWAWGYKSAGTPDDIVYRSVGERLAGKIQRLGGGTYTAMQACNFYPMSGYSDDWFYGVSHYTLGLPCLAFTPEVGTSFYQPTQDLDFICRENFKGAFWLAQYAESIKILLKGVVPPPQILPMDTNSTGNYYISWQRKNPLYNNPEKWELQELTGYSVILDSLEMGTTRWQLAGFSLRSNRAHSGSYSLYAESSNNRASFAQTTFPYLVNPNDSLTFWTWYDLENNYDVAVAEVSENGKEWFQLGDRLTGNSGGWVRKSYSLQPFIGKSVYIRIRQMTDGSILGAGFYLDDIYPVPFFSATRIISSNIPDTFYLMTNQSPGRYWYRVKGYNTSWGWGDYSQLEDIIVERVGIAERRTKLRIEKPFQNPFSSYLRIRYETSKPIPFRIKIYDITGRQVANFVIKTKRGENEITWRPSLPTGIYFLEIFTGDKRERYRLIINN